MNTINLIEYLENSSLNYPDKVAFYSFDGNEKKALNYKTLDELSKNIASNFLNFNKEPIAIYMDKDVDAISSMWGVIRSNNFYTIIDTKMPYDRVNTIIETLEPAFIITSLKLKDKIKTINFKNILFYENIIKTKINEDKLEDIKNNICDTDPVYSLFTSGSTGIPKGYIVNHRSVIDFVEQMTDVFKINSKTIIGNQSPLYFDLSIADLYASVKNSSTVYLMPQSIFMFPTKVIEFLNNYKINFIFWVPSALVLASSALHIMKPKYLKKVLFCGEVMPNKHLNVWRKYLPNIMYANLYGPAETVDASTYYIVNRKFKDDDVLPIGKPFKNTRIYVIDEENKLVTKNDVIGELCIGGSSLSMGYYNNKEKTSDAYVQNPINDKYIEMIYKTGDLVKYNKYMELEYVSRKDFQIKHMGYRIELGEIEVAASSIKELNEIACIYDDIHKYIILFYTGEKVDEAEIIDKLKLKLPKYMIPSKIIYKDVLVKNSNGKIDRKKLKEDYLKEI